MDKFKEDICMAIRWESGVSKWQMKGYMKILAIQHKKWARTSQLL